MFHSTNDTDLKSFLIRITSIIIASLVFVFLPVYLISKVGSNNIESNKENMILAFKKNEELICKNSYLVSKKSNWEIVLLNDKNYLKKEDILIDLSLCEMKKS